MVRFDDYANENKTVQELHSHNLKRPYIPDHHLYRILIIGGSGTRCQTKFFVMKILNKRELQQIALNRSSDINSEDFIKIYNILMNQNIFT